MTPQSAVDVTADEIAETLIRLLNARPDQIIVTGHADPEERYDVVFYGPWTAGLTAAAMIRAWSGLGLRAYGRHWHEGNPRRRDRIRAHVRRFFT